ncbi:MAG: choice-of-anchor D domain-containing protein, partial [Candidatus Kapaibacterium sp.]
TLLDGREIPKHRIAIASRTATDVTITYPNGNSLKRSLQPFQIWSLTLNGEQYECLGDSICTKSFEIVSDEPVSIYCFSSKTHTSDGYLALPLSSWGTEYFTANAAVDHYPFDIRDPDSCRLEPRPGEFAVIAGEDFTTVTVTATTPTRSGTAANVPQQKVLMKGEIWQIQADGNIRGQNDITGSHVVSDKAVGLLSGHVRTGMPWSYDTKDHLIEMIPPVNALGKRHIVVPFGGRRGGDIVRIIATKAGTTNATIKKNSGNIAYTLNGAGDFQEVLVAEVYVIETDQPVLVAHYSQSNDADPTSSFDPYMIVTTPEEQFANTAVFQTLPNLPSPGSPKQFDQHFVTIVSELANFNSLLINGSPLANDPRMVAQGKVPTLETQFVWLTLRLADNTAYVIQGKALFGGYVYGIGEWDSYGWPVGAGLFKEVYDTIPPVLWATPSCGELVYDIYASDSGGINKGLTDLFLDQNGSENVQVIERDPRTLPPAGTFDTARIRVRLIDPTKPGKARVIARDAGGFWDPNTQRYLNNEDTIEVELRAIIPTFSRDSILILKGQIGQLRRELISIINSEGDREINIDSLKLVRGVEFKIDGLGRGGTVDPSLIPTGEKRDFNITFQANDNGVYDDTLIVWVNCLSYRIPLKALMAVPLIQTHDLDFGTIRKGTEKCLELCVSNPGEGRLQINDIRITKNDGQVYSFGAKSLPDLFPFYLEPGEDTCIIVCFNPEELRTFTGKVEFISNAFGGNNVGNLIGKVKYPKIEIGGFDFGDVQVGDTKCDSVPITNTGTDTAYLTGVTILDNVFVEDPSIFDYALAPGETLWVPICFTPTVEKSFDSFIGADNKDGLEAVNSLKGVGYQLLAEIDGHDWGKQWVNTQHPYVVHIRNLTNRAIQIDSVWLEGGDDGDFALLTQIPPSITLGPNEEYPLDVLFSPLQVGDRAIGIYAMTSSRVKPKIENLLQGFGIQPIPADELVHDSSLIYSCDSRTSRIYLYNRGNAPLTLESVQLVNPEGVATLNAPGVGSQIPEGDIPLEVEVHFNFNSFVGTTTATVTWSFKELPGETFSRTMTISSEPQEYWITSAAPPQVDNGDRFDLYVTVDSAHWHGIFHSEVLLKIAYNPRVSLFDRERWSALTTQPTSDWTFVGEPNFIDPGVVLLTLRPTNGSPLPIEGTTFPSIPFRGFLGDQPIDTFRIAMQANSVECVLPVETMLPYSIYNICGLNYRLFYSAGDPPSLSGGKPNPATSHVALDFTIPFVGETKLVLFGIDGTEVTTILDGYLTAGD